MKTLHKQLWLSTLISLLLAGAAAAQVEEGTYTFGIEIKGGLCGYSEISVEKGETDGVGTIVMRQSTFMMLSALGSEFNTRVDATFNVDPQSWQYTGFSVRATQGEVELTGSVTVAGGEARCFSSLKDGETIVALTKGVILEVPLVLPFLKRDFVDQETKEKTYTALNGRSFKIDEVTYTRAGEEKLDLAGISFDTLMIDSLNRGTGVKSRFWIDVNTGMVVKISLPGERLVYLADPSVKKRIEMVNIDSTLAHKTNISIPDARGIVYIKVKAVLQPTGSWITAEGLSIPGQRFEGTVKENLIEGVFTVEHERYDGSGAPPFPKDYTADESLRGFLEPGEGIESRDPVLTRKAAEITAGSKDSWEAACRLCQWVADNINYEIPGGATARRTYDMRAGECGAHSVLLAAFCRSQGIPARVVWGCIYSPNMGGVFGQHAWNEIYMGEAGWITVDSTAHEIDFVDSGHIRLGVLATSISLNAKSFEVLDYRLKEETSSEGSEAAAAYAAFVGRYVPPGNGEPYEILVKDEGLALAVPGGRVLPFRDPDEKGFWFCTLSRNLFLEFPRDNESRADAFVMHQIHRMRRKSEPQGVEDTVPEAVKPLLGGYFLAALNKEFIVLWDSGRLAFRHPYKGVIHLDPPGDEGWRPGERGEYRVSFDIDETGEVRALLLDGMNTFTRQ